MVGIRSFPIGFRPPIFRCELLVSGRVNTNKKMVDQGKGSMAQRPYHVLVYHGLPFATFWEWRSPSTFNMCHGQARRYIGDKLIPPLIGILIMGRYKPLRNWVDEFIPYYMGNNRSWSTRSHIWTKFWSPKTGLHPAVDHFAPEKWLEVGRRDKPFHVGSNGNFSGENSLLKTSGAVTPLKFMGHFGYL